MQLIRVKLVFLALLKDGKLWCCFLSTRNVLLLLYCQLLLQLHFEIEFVVELRQENFIVKVFALCKLCWRHGVGEESFAGFAAHVG